MCQPGLALTPSPPLSPGGSVPRACLPPSPQNPAAAPPHGPHARPPDTLLRRAVLGLGTVLGPGTGRAECVCDSLPGAPAGHTPAPRLTSPLLPTGGPKARGGGRGGGAARPAPPASRDAGGARRGQGSLPSARGPPFGRECGSPGKCARGRRPGRHPPSRRGASVRPAPRPPGSPAFLAGACGFLPAPGARSWLAAGRGAGRAGQEQREGAAAEGDSPGLTRGRSRAGRNSLRSATADTHLGHRSPRPAPPAPPGVRARVLLHLRVQATVSQPPAEKRGAKGWKLRRDCSKVRQADRAAVARVGVPQALRLEAA